MPSASRWQTAKRALAVPAVVALAALVFAIGRWSGAEPAPARAGVASSPAGRPANPRAAPPAAGASLAPPARAGAPTIPAAPEVPAADKVALATWSARTRLERLRDEVIAPCLPRAAPDARRSTNVTFSLTFDARGREIARGVSADRRTPPDRVLAACLRRLPRVGSITIPAPGSTVGVKVAMTLP